MLHDISPPVRVDRQTANVAEQFERAYAAVKRLPAMGCSVNEVVLGGKHPVIKVRLYPGAKCLPGMSLVRAGNAATGSVKRQAWVLGCRVLWVPTQEFKT